MENPTRPAYKGKLQIRRANALTTVYEDIGDIALWIHENSKYPLRGYVTINNEKYVVSLTENE